MKHILLVFFLFIGILVFGCGDEDGVGSPIAYVPYDQANFKYCIGKWWFRYSPGTVEEEEFRLSAYCDDTNQTAPYICQGSAKDPGYPNYGWRFHFELQYYGNTTRIFGDLSNGYGGFWAKFAEEVGEVDCSSGQVEGIVWRCNPGGCMVLSPAEDEEVIGTFTAIPSME